MRIMRFSKGVLAWVLYFFHLVELSSRVIGMNEILPGVVFPNMATVVLISVWGYLENLVWNEPYLSDYFCPADEAF